MVYEAFKGLNIEDLNFDRLTDEELLFLEEQIRLEDIERASQSFWSYCKVTSPEFYKKKYHHLVTLCNTLEALKENRIVKFSYDTDWRILTREEKSETFSLTPEICHNLMINMPPQHGKTRTLIKFAEYCYGQNHQERVINGSYNDTAASDFGRYTRDSIGEEKNTKEQIVFSDIFPETKLKHGNKSYKKWALAGEFFSFLSTGIGGSVTGKGGTLKIVDDLVKGAKEAMNRKALEAIWVWYVGTFGSRNSVSAEATKEIMCFTRWSKHDPCGKILASNQAKNWFVLKMEVYDEETDTMLCEDFLSKEKYWQLREMYMQNIITQMIFFANYHQRTIDMQGRLYKTLLTYIDVPRDRLTKPLFQEIRAYIDTADSGTDYLCAVAYGVFKNGNGVKEAYVLDVIYTQEGMEVTDNQVADFLYQNQVDYANVESNNGGKGFSRDVERIMNEKFAGHKCVIDGFHQSDNKETRILSASAWVQRHIYFPVNWQDKWPDFYASITEYQKEGNNEHDDAEDVLSGIKEELTEEGEWFDPTLEVTLAEGEGTNLSNYTRYSI